MQRRIGAYQVEKKLGQGGMGEVFLAIQKVAIKRLHPDIQEGQKDESLKMFMDEMRNTAQINHDNVVRILESSTDDEGPYIIMEYVEGLNLHQVSKALHGTGQKPTLEEIVAVGLQLCDGLAAVHGAELLHRDLKPTNVLLAEDGLVKIIDFGIAKSQDNDALTKLGVVKGTPSYYSPEQAEGQILDEKSDLFSVGRLLFELATGETLFPDESSDKSIIAIGRHDLNSQNFENPERRERILSLEGGLGNVLLRVLAREPADRHESALALKEALRKLVPGISFGKVKSLGKQLHEKTYKADVQLQQSYEAKTKGVEPPSILQETKHLPPTEEANLPQPSLDGEIGEEPDKPSNLPKPKLTSLVVASLVSSLLSGVLTFWLGGKVFTQSSSAQQHRNKSNKTCGEGRMRNCSTACGSGVETCKAGKWIGCNAPPVAKEMCNNKDDDCDGQTDEDYTDKGQKCSLGTGECQRTSTFICKPDGSGIYCKVAVGLPSKEICDGKDNDCDGKTDEDLKRNCYTGRTGTLSVGTCKAGLQTCQQGAWSKCLGEVTPTTEVCDGKDNDCDGLSDNVILWRTSSFCQQNRPYFFRKTIAPKTCRRISFAEASERCKRKGKRLPLKRELPLVRKPGARGEYAWTKQGRGFCSQDKKGEKLTCVSVDQPTEKSEACFRCVKETAIKEQKKTE